MRMEVPRELERFGANLFYGVQKVYELDSGLEADVETERGEGIIQAFSYDTLHDIEQDMVIVVPVKEEKLKLLKGVLYGIPHHCKVIVLSNSPRKPIDRFAIEREALKNYCQYTGKPVMVVHQKNPRLAAALQEAGYTDLLGEDGRVTDGKAQGMLLATLLARLTGRKYLGFIDADNYFPGAVYEYIKLYAAGFAQSKTDNTMVRVVWHSKPKVVDDNLFFAKYGRTSVVTNRILNDLISRYTGFETEVIRTGNAGEHAITMDLAMSIDYASGYSIEPYHLIYLLERYGGVIQTLTPETIQRHVEVFQLESRNPHLHEAKGEEHVEHMIYKAMQVIYHSPVTPESLKDEILRELRQRGLLGADEALPPATYYPALSNVDLPTFVRAIRNEPFARFLDATLLGQLARQDGAGQKGSRRVAKNGDKEAVQKSEPTMTRKAPETS